MPRIVFCPSCQAKGSVPDGATIARIRCPKCNESFAVDQSTASSPSRSMRAPEKPSKRTGNSAFDDLASAEPEPVHLSGKAPRSSAALPPAHSGGSSGQSPLIYAIMGGSGVAVVALLAVIVILMSRGGDAPPRPAASDAPAPKLNVAAAAAAEETPAPAPQPLAVASPVASAIAEPADMSIPGATPQPAPDHQTVINRLKNASVYIVLKVDGKPISTGSGFAIEAAGDRVLIATNRHVVVPDRAHFGYTSGWKDGKAVGRCGIS
jgi:hypothetical protein